MQDKIRRVYDLLLALETSSEGDEQKGKQSISLPEKMPEAAIPESAKSKKHENSEALSANTPLETAPKTELKKEVSKEFDTKKSTVEEPGKEKKVTSDPSDQETPTKEKPHSTKSTIDLFSETTEETIAEKLGAGDDSSIAKKMETRKISNLKQVIGINEKFLFINELFGGDLGRYNSTIEEFDRIQTVEGAKAHLRELKVSHQWGDDNEAFLKFKSLVERKSTP
ncbi:MAG: hypothetical protein P8100_06145 [bacterium]